MDCRKAQASVLAVDERQKLETLTRDEKTASRALTQLTERLQGLEEKINTRRDDLAAQTGKKAEVMLRSLIHLNVLLMVFLTVGRENIIATDGISQNQVRAG